MSERPANYKWPLGTVFHLAVMGADAIGQTSGLDSPVWCERERTSEMAVLLAPRRGVVICPDCKRIRAEKMPGIMALQQRKLAESRKKKGYRQDTKFWPFLRQTS